MIIVEDSIINSLWTCAVIIGLYIFFCSPWNRSIQTYIPSRFGINAAPVGRRGTGDFARTLFLLPAGHWATPFTVMTFWAVTPVDHAESGSAQRSSVVINVQTFRDGLRSATVGVHVYKRTDVPFFTEIIGRIVVMGWIKTDVLHLYTGVDLPKFSKWDNPGNAVMPFCIEKTDV